MGSKHILKEKVTDGTSCSFLTSNKTSSVDEYAICVDGKCKSAGCDRVLGSGLRRDSCGVCGGDNSTCAYVRQSYRPSHIRYGYSLAIVLPANASNIIIRHERRRSHSQKDSGNFLALKEPDTSAYLLNGNFVISLYPLSVFLPNDAIIEYSGSSSEVETIKIKQRIPHKINLEILSMGITSPVITYEYFVSRNAVLYRRSFRPLLPTTFQTRHQKTNL